MSAEGDDKQTRGLHEWFPAYHPRTDAELDSFVQSGLIALDANVLLDLYRYVPQARRDLLGALAALGMRLWIPHQAAKEFHERRFNAIDNQARSFTEAKSQLVDSRSSASRAIRQLQNNCAIPANDVEGFQSGLERAFQVALDAIGQLEADLDMNAEKAISEDHILDEIAELLQGKVGAPFTPTEIQALEGESATRYEKEIPPGYEDAAKKDGRGIGDLILWKQLLSEAKRRSLPVLLLSREQKKDWVRRRNEDVLGPRPELLDEMRTVAGADFHMLHPANFLSAASRALGVEVHDASLESISRQQIRDEEKELDAKFMSDVIFTAEQYQDLYNEAMRLESVLARVGDTRRQAQFEEMHARAMVEECRPGSQEAQLAIERYEAASNASMSEQAREAHLRHEQEVLRAHLSRLQSEVRSLRNAAIHRLKGREAGILQDGVERLSRLPGIAQE